MKWPIPDNNPTGRKIEYRAWFQDGYDTAKTPYDNIQNAIYGDKGAERLFGGNVDWFKANGPCTMFAVAYKDSPEVLIVPDDDYVYLVDREAIGKRGLKERDRNRVRSACGSVRMKLDDYRSYSGIAPLELEAESSSGVSAPHHEEPPQTPTASDLGDPPERVETTTYRILRDSMLARRVKQIHNWECQICGEFIVLPDGSRYAEAHHIQPLGQPHGGTDVEANVMCVCPNHHAELDYGVRQLDISTLPERDGHQIAECFVKYHNEQIFGRPRS